MNGSNYKQKTMHVSMQTLKQTNSIPHSLCCPIPHIQNTSPNETARKFH